MKEGQEQLEEDPAGRGRGAGSRGAEAAAVGVRCGGETFVLHQKAQTEQEEAAAAKRKAPHSDHKVCSPYEAASAAANTQKGPQQGRAAATDTGGAQGSRSPAAVPGGPTQEELDQLEAQEDEARVALGGMQEQAPTLVQ